VSRRKVYEVLAKLVQKGLCTETLGKVKKYSPVNPKVGFDNLFKEIEKKKRKLTDLSEALLPLYLSEKENINPLDYIQVLREKSRIAEKVYSLERMAKEEVLSFSKAPYAMNISTRMNEEEFRGLERGVKYKAICEVVEARKLDFIKRRGMYMEGGEEIRVVNELPMKMIIFDDRKQQKMNKDKPKIETTTLWDFATQNYGDKTHGDNKYRGVTPAFVIWNLLQRYTKEGDLVEQGLNKIN